MPLNDVLAITGKGSICLMNYNETDSEFEMFHFFKGIHSGQITDATFSGDGLFSCCPKDDFVHEIRMRNKEKYRMDVNKELARIQKEEEMKYERRKTLFENMEPAESAKSG